MTRLTVFITLFLALVLSVGVFRITYQVDELEKRLHTLNKDILEEQETIHILQAEWSYLNDPNRLDELSKRYLGMEKMTGGQLVNMDEFEEMLILPEGNHVLMTKPARLER